MARTIFDDAADGVDRLTESLKKAAPALDAVGTKAATVQKSTSNLGPGGGNPFAPPGGSQNPGTGPGGGSVGFHPDGGGGGGLDFGGGEGGGGGGLGNDARLAAELAAYGKGSGPGSGGGVAAASSARRSGLATSRAGQPHYPNKGGLLAYVPDTSAGPDGVWNEDGTTFTRGWPVYSEPGHVLDSIESEDRTTVLWSRDAADYRTAGGGAAGSGGGSRSSGAGAPGTGGGSRTGYTPRTPPGYVAQTTGGTSSPDVVTRGDLVVAGAIKQLADTILALWQKSPQTDAGTDLRKLGLI